MLKYSLMFLLLLAVSIRGNGQDQVKIDSLSSVVSSLSDGEEKVRALIALSSCWLVADASKAIPKAEKALELAKNIDNQELLVDALKAAALSHGYNLDPENSKPYYLEAVEVLENMDSPRRQGNMYLNLGADYQYTRQFDSSMYYMLEALPFYKEAQDTSGISKVHNNLAIVYRAVGYYEKAIESYALSISQKRKLADEEGMMNSYLNISALYYQISEFDSAQKYGHLSIELAKKLDDGHTQGMALVNLCLVESDKKNWSRALDIARESEHELTLADDHRMLCALHSNMSLIYARLGKCDSSEYYQSISCVDGQFATDNIHKIKALASAICSEKNGQFETAYFAMKDYAAYSDTVFAEKQRQGTAELTYNYEQALIQSEILQKEKALSESEAKGSRLAAIVFAISGLAVLLLSVILLLNVRAKRRRERDEAELQRQVGEIDILQSKLATLADAPLPEVAMSLNAHQVNELLVNPLTERELEVLTMIATGKSNQQIADAMFVSINTVKTHIHKIYEKLDVKNRTEATLKASSLNLINR